MVGQTTPITWLPYSSVFPVNTWSLIFKMVTCQCHTWQTEPSSLFVSFFLFTYPKKKVCFFFSPCYCVVIIIHRIYDLTGKSWCIARGHWVSWAVRVWENWRGGVLAYPQGQGWHGCAKFSWGWAGLCNKKSLFWSSLIRIDSSCVKWLL